MQIRSDIADCGLYVISFQGYKLLTHVTNELELEWLDISEDVIPFLAKN